MSLVLGLGFFLCPWPWSRRLCPRLHLCYKTSIITTRGAANLLRCSPQFRRSASPCSGSRDPMTSLRRGGTESIQQAQSECAFPISQRSSRWSWKSKGLCCNGLGVMWSGWEGVKSFDIYLPIHKTWADLNNSGHVRSLTSASPTPQKYYPKMACGDNLAADDFKSTYRCDSCRCKFFRCMLFWALRTVPQVPYGFSCRPMPKKLKRGKFLMISLGPWLW